MKGSVLKALAVLALCAGFTVFAQRAPSYFESEEATWSVWDRISDRSVRAVWDRDAEKWTATWADSHEVLDVTPELKARWNGKVRGQVLEKIEKRRAVVLTKKLEVVSERLAGMVAEALPRGSGLKEIDLEFLALLRDPRDRPFFERLLDKSEVDAKIVAGLVPNYYWSGRKRPSGGFGGNFQLNDPDLLAADRFLAVFDGKAEKKRGLFRGRDRMLSSFSGDTIDSEKRHNLGEVEGEIKFATPLKAPFGTFRIYLCMETNRGWETGKDTVSLAKSRGSSDTWLIDELSFLFSTVRPGRYFAKVIWDRRTPFDNVAEAGPGDYESDFTGPFEVVAGGVVTNILLHCVKEGRGGDAYFAADKQTAKLWDEGEIAGRTFSGNEVLSKAAREWIIRTNRSSERAWVNSIALVKGFRTRMEQRDWPGMLAFLARTEAGKSTNELTGLEIRDEHGCVFKQSDVGGDNHTKEFYFYNFPRGSSEWRVVGFGENGAEEFDFAMTNLVKARRTEAAANALPLEVDIGEVKMRVNGVNPTREWGRWYARLNCEFIDKTSGQVTTNWIWMDARFVDAQGNENNPAEFCREEKAARLTGRVFNREKLRAQMQTLSPADRARRMLQGPAVIDAVPFEFSISREAVGAVIE